MILSKYILRNFIKPLLMGVMVFTGILLMEKVFDLTDLLINRGVDFKVAVQLFALFVPSLVVLSLPLSFLLAGMSSFGQLSQDYEIVAMRAAGISPFRVLWPPILLGFFLSLGMIVFNLRLAPMAHHSFKSMYEKIAHSDPLIQWEARRFFSVSNFRIYAREVFLDGHHLRGILLYQLPQSKEEDYRRIFAEEADAQITSDSLILDLKRGQIAHFDSLDPQKYIHVNFDKYALKIPFNIGIGNYDVGIRGLLGEELLELATKENRPEVYLAEYHFRIAIGLGVFSLAFLGCVLGFSLGHGGRGLTLGASLVVAFLYYLVLLLGTNLAERTVLPAWFALELPNLICLGTAGIILIRKFR